MAGADEQLLVEAAQRDPSRFADLYERHFERIYAFVVRRVRDRDAAEELTAEVFHRALKHLPTFRPTGAPFGAWLFSIARNALIDRAKLGAREVVDSARLPDLGFEPEADDEIDRVDALARLFRFVEELPADQRTVIVDRFVDERSIRETATRLGRSEGAVKQLQVRALETLRKRMHGSAERRDG